MNSGRIFLDKSRTPILDLELPFEAANASRWLGNDMTARDVLIVSAVLVGAVIGVIYGSQHELVIQVSSRTSKLVALLLDCFDVFSFPNMLIAFVLLLPIVAVHEAGHALAAKLNGLRVTSMKVGPFWVIGRGGRALFGQPDILGFVTAEFLTIRRIRRRYLWLTVGGPLASIIVGLILQLLSFYIPRNVGDWVHVAGVVSLWLAVLSLWPFRAAFYGSDGFQIKRLYYPAQKYAPLLANVALDVASANGADVSSWRRSWLEKASQSDRKDPVWRNAQLRLYVWASDRKDVSLAASSLEALLNDAVSSPPSHRKSLALEAAVFQAWHRQDAVKASVWAKRVSEFAASTPELQQIRYSVALFCCTHEFDKAISQWEKGLLILKAMPGSKRGDAVLRAWQKWRDEIEERRILYETTAVNLGADTSA